MAYATLIHVEALNTARGEFTANTKPSATQVTLFIHHAAADMDFAMTRAGYSVPVPMGTSSVPSAVQTYLEHVNALGAAVLVENSAQVASDRKKDYNGAWIAALRMIAAGELPGLAKDSAQSLPRTNAVATAFFTRDMEL